MPFWKSILSLGVTILLTLFLNGNITIPGLPIPPPGVFFSPFHGFWQQAEPMAVPKSLTIKTGFPNDSVQVVFDQRMVPHIFAQSLRDAVFVQGYLHAKNRLWQMDISTRAAAGRVSEILGPRALPHDLFQRRKGILRVAKASVELWEKEDEQFDMIEAYTAGVNHFVDNLSPRDYPLEFKLLNYEPEPWTPVKSILMLANMTEVLSGRNDDFMATNALKILGEDTYNFLFPEYNPKQSPVIPKDVKWDYFSPQKPDKEGKPSVLIGSTVPHPDYPAPPEHIGSNNWALEGKKTATGQPILCNDPHLELTLPSIWYEMQMQCDDRNVYGVSLPGIPSIVIGFNEHIAFGLTNVGQDVLDWYELEWADSNRQHYYLNNELFEVESYVETIQVRGEPDVQDTVKWSVWGPIPYPDDPVKRDLAMHWVAHDIPEVSQVNALLDLNAAKNYPDFDEATEKIDFPAQNIIFASKKNRIALKVQGKFPLKNPGDGQFIHPGHTFEYAWKDYISKRHLPKVIDPASGYVGSANQRSTTPEYPYYYNGYFDDYRGRYLHRQLAEMKSATVQDMKSLQTSNYSILAEEALPVLLSYLHPEKMDDQMKKVYDGLTEWNYRFDPFKTAPSIFVHFYDLVYRNTWDELYALRDSIPFPTPENWRFIEVLEKEGNHPYFDRKQTPEEETARQIVQQAFEETVRWVEKLDIENELYWTNRKCFAIRHLGRIDAFSSDVLDVGGFADALNAINAERGTGPSWRMIVSLEDKTKAWGVYPGGQSGNPGSPYYDTFVQHWVSGEYYPLHYIGAPGELAEQQVMQQTFK